MPVVMVSTRSGSGEVSLGAGRGRLDDEGSASCEEAPESAESHSVQASWSSSDCSHDVVGGDEDVGGGLKVASSAKEMVGAADGGPERASCSCFACAVCSALVRVGRVRLVAVGGVGLRRRVGAVGDFKTFDLCYIKNHVVKNSGSAQHGGGVLSYTAVSFLRPPPRPPPPRPPPRPRPPLLLPRLRPPPLPPPGRGRKTLWMTPASSVSIAEVGAGMPLACLRCEERGVRPGPVLYVTEGGRLWARGRLWCPRRRDL